MSREDWGTMIDNTINDDKTIAGGGKGAILAGRYHILRQLGQGGEKRSMKMVQYAA